jgi:peptidyl-prolyl cis-trans isomerase A (cyclophilin A)
MRSSTSTFGLLLLLVVSLLSCGEEATVEAPPPEPVKPPEVYQVKFQTSKGDFIVEVHRDWAPYGADHFFELVTNGFYDGVRFHRVIRRYIVQWGISGDPEVQSIYGQMQIRDDPVKENNTRGTVSFAKLGPASRTTQVFINLRDNSALDEEGFVPFGKVVEGMDVVERLWSSYGETAPRGAGPDPTRIMTEGNAYLDREFPRLDSITRATIVPVEPDAVPAE